MASEYIERNSVLNIVKGNWMFMTSADDAMQTSVDMIRRLPAADVVEVVRCRDCKFRSNEWTGCPKLNGTITGDEFFCAVGKKREES